MNVKISVMIQEKDQEFYSQKRQEAFGIVVMIDWALIAIISFIPLDSLSG